MLFRSVAIHTRDMAESIAFYEKIGGSLSQQAALQTPDGEKKLALVSFRHPEIPLAEGNLPHIAIYVDDLDAAAEELKAAGVDTFMTPAKSVLPTLFGGLENWFFTGPSGEQIELLHML